MKRKTNYQIKQWKVLTWMIDVRLYVLPKLKTPEEKSFWLSLLHSRCKAYGLLGKLHAPLETRYYYVDDCNGMEVSEYENEEEFLSGMYWNRDVAKEYGDKVPTLKQIKNDLAHPNADQYFNGAWFLKLTGITPDEYFDRGFVYAR